MPEQKKVEFVPSEQLLLDARNPRLVELTLASGGALSAQDDILQAIWENMAIDELALSIEANGFFGHEPLWVEPDGDKYVVIEGNRRFATVRLLLDGKLRRKLKATDLPALDDKKLESLRALPVWKTSRTEAWRAIGFKHVHGPRLWTSYAKAQYIAQLRSPEYGRLSLDEIAKSIGDSHGTVARLHHALAVIKQAERAGVFNRDDRWKKHFSFSHLYTGLGYASGIANFIGLKEAGKDLENSPVPENKMEELGKLLVWIYGSKKQGKNPLVRSQNPDIRLLDKALQKKEGVDMLNGDHSLEDAAEAARGDHVMLRDHLLNAKGAMEKALGKIRGYGGDGELMRHAESVRDSASSLLHLMDRADRKKGGD